MANTPDQEKETDRWSGYEIDEVERTSEDEDDYNWVDICHGCLRFLFAVIFFIIVLSAAFISRITFHMLLINLNPPTIFTSMNKFGGDIANTTIPFEPAEVHISWVWALFLVLVAPSLHQLVYHLKQKCMKDEKTENYASANESKENINVQFVSSKVNNLENTNGNQMPQVEFASNSVQHHFPRKKISIKCQWFFVIIFGIIQAVCETLAVFVLLPTFDQATAGIITIFMTISIPYMLNGMFDQWIRNGKRFPSKWMSNVYMGLSSIFFFLTFALYIAFVVLISNTSQSNLSGLMATVILIPFGLSAGFWENLSGFQFEILQNRNMTMTIVSSLRLGTMLLTFIILFGGMGGLGTLFGSPDTTIAMFDRNIRLVNSLSFGGNCSTSLPMLMAVISVVASYACYKFSFYACRSNLQWQSFSLPHIINIFVVPFFVGYAFTPDTFYTQIQNCSIISNNWDFIIDQGNTTNQSLVISFGCSTLCCVIVLTYYIWGRGTKIGQIEIIFAMPIYAGYAVDITLLWAKRRTESSYNSNKTGNGNQLQSRYPNRTMNNISCCFQEVMYMFYLLRYKPGVENTRTCAETPHNPSENTRKTRCGQCGNVECDKCKDKIPQNQLSMHKEFQCCYRVVKCVCCSKNIPFYQMQDHSDDCRKYLLECPYGCPNKVQRIKMKRHLQSCPKKTVYCGFRNIGCGYHNTVKNVKNHQDTESKYHLNLATSFPRQTSDQSKTLPTEIETCCEESENTVVEECDQCKDKIPQNQLSVHKKSQCSYRVVVCNYCSKNVVFCKKQSHFNNECQDEPRRCPNCREDLRRTEIKSHLQTCPKKSIHCGYKSIGCKYHDIPEKVENHHASANDHHRRLSTSFSRDQNKASHKEKKKDTEETFILALDGDVDFKPDAVLRLLERMLKNADVGAACGRILPLGGGPIVWYQKFEYAVSHWLQKSTEHVFGCVLCSPGCFSLFRASALLRSNILKTYKKEPSTALEYIQYDQGEDRLLSTLLLKNNFKLEYTAASDAYTYVPEGFFEFFNQRRRWAPSTLANILEIIVCASSVTKTNKYISRLYLVYQMFLFASSLITPGTIFLMILGATTLAFPVIPIWLAFLINLSLVAIVIAACVLAEDKTQLRIAAVISAIYSLMMVVVLFGLIIDAISSGFCSVTTYFFIYVAGIFCLAALLHPREFLNIIYGALYFLAVPTTSMILLIYALGNLHVTSWGTRESDKRRKGKKQSFEDGDDSYFCCGLCRCSCTPKIIYKKETGKELSKPKKKAKKTKEKSKKKKEEKQSVETTRKTKQSSESHKGAESPKKAQESSESHEGAETTEKTKQTSESYEESTTKKHDDAFGEETEFWKSVLNSVLKPKRTENDQQKKRLLMDLRNGVFAGFVMINLIYITIVFVITQANELNSDVFTVRLPCPNRNGTFDVDPISVVFTITFGLVLFFQFIGMLIHRFSTFSHIVAVSDMCSIKSMKGKTCYKANPYGNNGQKKQITWETIQERSKELWSKENSSNQSRA